MDGGVRVGEGFREHKITSNGSELSVHSITKHLVSYFKYHYYATIVP